MEVRRRHDRRRISEYSESRIQITVNEVSTQISELKFQLSEKKCEELGIGFGKPSADFDPVIVSDIPLEVVPCAKILGLTVSSNLKSGMITFIKPSCKQESDCIF